MRHIEAAGIMADACLCFRARRAARAITRCYDAALRPTGLQATQVTLMSAIALAPEGVQPVSGLSAHLGLDLSTLTRNLSALERAGLVRVSRHPDDRRVRVACLSEAGQQRLAAARPHWQAAHETVLAALGGGGAAALHEVLDAAALALGPGRAGLGEGPDQPGPGLPGAGNV